MSDLGRFVEQRIAENTLPPTVQRAYQTVYALSDTIRADGKTNDWVSWLTGTSAAVKVGEYILGADPASDATRISETLRATLARTWHEHPDYDDAWNDLAPDPNPR